MKSLKCVVDGDYQVGKTSLLITYTTNVFPCEYVPYLFDDHLVNLRVENQSIELHLWDIVGQESHSKMIPLVYPSTDCFILCFSLVSLISLENIENTYVPLIKKYCPNIPFIIVGMKSDLRDAYAQHENRKGCFFQFT